jgi:dolichyl-phosphate-mannose--protein O-mannosyl transferase
VFDEVHFATYAGQYAAGVAHFDMHPPLGKLIYAAGLTLTGGAADPPREFLTVRWDNERHAAAATVIDRPFGAFPYEALRRIGGIFGILLPIAFYFFLVAIGIGQGSALIAAALIVLENAMLLETRLVLMNFKKNPFPVAGGLLWGAALGVKLVAGLFIAPVLVAAYLSAELRPLALRFAAAAAVALGAILLLNGFFFSPQDRVGALLSLMPGDAGAVRSREVNALQASLVEAFFGGASYVAGETAAVRAEERRIDSRWYEWPTMGGVMPYYYAGTNHAFLELRGNPVVWFGSGIALLAGFGYLALRLWQARTKQEFTDTLARERTLTLLVSGYLFITLVFALIVHRPAFLYHYFPALLFALGVLAWLCDRIAEKLPAGMHRAAAAGGLIALVALGFFVTAPTTFGF